MNGTAPQFMDRLSYAYSKRRKSVVLLTGDTLDLFWSAEPEQFLPLEQALYQRLRKKMLVLKLDSSSGISFYDNSDRKQLVQICAQADALESKKEDRLGNIEARLERTLHEPLPALVLLGAILEAASRVRSVKKGDADGEFRDICVIIQYAGALFPAGEFDRLNELDRQRLITFLNTITNPSFVKGDNLVILVSDTRSEVNSRILALSHAEAIELGLPTRGEREWFVEWFCRSNTRVAFEDNNRARFVEDSAGLKLTGVEDLLEVSQSIGAPITRKSLVDEVNARVSAELDDVVQVVRPEHTPADIIGYAATNAVLTQIFEDCEDPDTAIPVVIVSGPNGSGKTFQMEAYATSSGRVVIRLAGIRSQWYGGTDKLLERLRLLIETYGKLEIMVDEAHTQFGSVHKSDTHETEKRLSGAIISMMSDPRYLGKVVWVLMTSRPDELDPDIKSRAPEQIPIFDLDGEERQAFVKEMFTRKKIELTEEELGRIMELTKHFSNRDFKNMLAKVRAKRKRQPDLSPVDVLREWVATSAIIDQRRMQTLIAAEHCSYPQLLPKGIAEMTAEQRADELQTLRLLHRN